MSNPYDTINTHQTELNKQYSDYTSAYLTYIDCSKLNIVNKDVDGYPKKCTDPNKDALQAAITDVSNDLLNLPKVPGDDTINASYKDLINMRSNLDLKLQDLYNLQNSAPNIYQTQLDSSIYSGILWTVLATTLIYYVFTKL